jgi:hypothetical protein
MDGSEFTSWPDNVPRPDSKSPPVNPQGLPVSAAAVVTAGASGKGEGTGSTPIIPREAPVAAGASSRAHAPVYQGRDQWRNANDPPGPSGQGRIFGDQPPTVSKAPAWLQWITGTGTGTSSATAQSELQLLRGEVERWKADARAQYKEVIRLNALVAKLNRTVADAETRAKTVLTARMSEAMAGKQDNLAATFPANQTIADRYRTLMDAGTRADVIDAIREFSILDPNQIDDSELQIWIEQRLNHLLYECDCLVREESDKIRPLIQEVCARTVHVMRTAPGETRPTPVVDNAQLAALENVINDWIRLHFHELNIRPTVDPPAGPREGPSNWGTCGDAKTATTAADATTGATPTPTTATPTASVAATPSAYAQIMAESIALQRIRVHMDTISRNLGNPTTGPAVERREQCFKLLWEYVRQCLDVCWHFGMASPPLCLEWVRKNSDARWVDHTIHPLRSRSIVPQPVQWVLYPPLFNADGIVVVKGCAI